MVMRADGSGCPMPLCIYPPGIDLSRFLILDPPTGEWVSGAGYVTSQPSLSRPQPNDPQPDDPAPPDPGFYQVARVGIHVVGLSNLTATVASGTISIPFEAANPSGTLYDLTALVDGTRYRGAIPQIAPGIGGPLLLDTTFLENGDHYFQIEGNWLNPDTDDPNNYNLQQFSDSFMLTVSNFIYFPEWEDEVGELGFSAYLAKTTCTNTDWRIDIYDVGSNYVQTLTGHTDDGIIEAYWNLMDTNGVARTNAAVDPVFSAIITVGDPTSAAAPEKVATLPYPDQGGWAIAYQDLFFNYANSNQYYNVIYSMGSIGQQFGGAYSYLPVTGHPEYGQTFPLRYATTNRPVPWAYQFSDLHALENLISNTVSRNFFYNGHGVANGIANMLSADTIQYVVLQNKTNNLPRHYYRFVFLDACEGANGSLPAAFGINFNSPQNLSYFQKHGIRPRAFVGYDISVNWCYPGPCNDPQTGQPRDGRIPDSVYYFLGNFESFWYFGDDLSYAIYSAIQATPYIAEGWATGENLQVYGYQWLHVDEYNHNSNWSN